MGDFFMRVAAGTLEFSKGGVLIAETNDVARSLTLPVGLGLLEYDPYTKGDVCDYGVANAMLQNGGIKSLIIKNLSKEHTRNLLQFWKSAGIMTAREYPCKVAQNNLDKLEDEVKTKRLGGGFENEVSPDHFEKLVQNYFSISSGNPGFLLKSVALSY
ncbi:uncharacterized protein PRCAT00000167001 [Priceomyces carsonii]|uniref:uncharacterized protein n=1 Tax=Priceomyces carsonii TaxID=28549 RepID=UPI002EDA7DA7|nr:unnamed protein product [Priceomyces carsonii]